MKIVHAFGWMIGFAFNWASDGYWDWTLKTGDVMYTALSVHAIRRQGQPQLNMLVIGPVVLTVIVQRIDR